jgi:hypothetical protein
MFSKIALERRRTIAKKALLVRTLSFFISSVSSFGTHLADFFESFRSSLSV